MFATFSSSLLAIVLAFLGSWALRLLSVRWARGREGSRRLRWVAALRLGLVIFVVVVALAQLITASGGLNWPVRWVVGLAGAVCTLPWLGNAVAGLWVLSPFFQAGPGDAVVLCGQRGRIVGYGLTRLELETEEGWIAHLSYVAVAARPLLISNPGRARGLELMIERQDWTEDKLQLLREAVILAPYRDLSSPVSVSRRADLVSVHLSLSRRGSEAQLRRFLDAALARHERARALVLDREGSHEH